MKLYKRAQILVADLWAAFRGRSYGAFVDIDSITMFADYRVPQVSFKSTHDVAEGRFSLGCIVCVRVCTLWCVCVCRAWSIWGCWSTQKRC